MPFLSPKQQCPSTEGKAHVCTKSMSDKAFKSLSITRIHLVVEDKLWNSLPDDITSASVIAVSIQKETEKALISAIISGVSH